MITIATVRKEAKKVHDKIVIQDISWHREWDFKVYAPSGYLFYATMDPIISKIYSKGDKEQREQVLQDLIDDIQLGIYKKEN